jgi:ferredoxin-NADP reductase
VGRFKYTKNAYNRIGLIAGGTGLTPCLQVIRCILEGPEGEGDTTSFVLLFQNRSEADILLRQELNDLVAMSGGRLEVFYYLSNPTTAQWGKLSYEHRGYINAEAVQRLLRPEVAQMVGICGPGGFVESMQGLLAEVGHKGEESVHCW